MSKGVQAPACVRRHAADPLDARQSSNLVGRPAGVSYAEGGAEYESS
jgi:hypothetical protein